MAERDNAAFVALNRVDAEHGGVVTAGAALAGLPAANLQDRQISRVARIPSVSSASTWWQVDFGQNRIVDIVALLAHNLTQAATWRVRLSLASDMSSPLYDSGTVDAWPPVGGFGNLPWGVFSWGNELSSNELAFYSGQSFAILPDSVTARYLRVDIVDTSNTAGYIEAGRLVAGPAWFPSRNLLYGWSIGWQDDSTVDKSLGGQTFVDQKPLYRVLRFALTGIEEAELMSNSFDFLQRRKGLSGDLLFIPQPQRPEMLLHEAIYGRLRSMTPVTNPSVGVRAQEFELEELL